MDNVGLEGALPQVPEDTQSTNLAEVRIPKSENDAINIRAEPVPSDDTTARIHVAAQDAKIGPVPDSPADSSGANASRDAVHVNTSISPHGSDTPAPSADGNQSNDDDLEAEIIRVENNPTLPLLSMISPQAKKRAKSARVSVCDARCRTSLRAVRAAIKRLGWEEITNETAEASVIWMEHHDSPVSLTPHQVCSKIEGFVQLCRKSSVAYLVNRMYDAFPHLYQFVPRTWILRRDEYEQALALERTMNEKKGWIFICKPSAGSLGRGLQLVKKWSDLKGVLKEVWPNGQEEGPPRRKRPEYVVQRYVTRPLLVDGYKFDCRVYVVVTSALPLVAYLFEEGLGRFCTVQYEKPRARNLGNAFMHLTNYSVNRHSAKFRSSRAHDSGSKRSLSAILQYLEEAGGPTAATLWASVKELCERTLLALQPGLIEQYSTRQTKVGLHPHGPKGFQIIGLDILFEENHRLRLLEVNSNPSMSCLTPMADPTSKDYVPLRKPDGALKMEISTLDFAVKVELIAQALVVANPMSHRKAMLGRQEFLERSGGLPCSAVFSEPIPSAEQRRSANPCRISDRPRRAPALQPLDFTGKPHAVVREAINAYDVLYRVFRDSLNNSSLFNRTAFRTLCDQCDLFVDQTFFEDRAEADAFFTSALRSSQTEAGEAMEGMGLNYPQFLRHICSPFGKRIDPRSDIHGLMAFARRCRPDLEEVSDVATSSTDEQSPVRSFR
eukprot:GEMP01013397.1.p1 GENE.GEMP01013397.1~~GEMP01013397.1.p1  ORF type:complete len:724 (+),score=91.55 GEMP01013397.1:24-2195(+)